MQTSLITIHDINCPNGDNSPKEAGDTRLPASMPTRHSQGAACSCPILYKSNDNSAKMKIENILQSGSDGKQSYLSKADIPLIEISEHQALEDIIRERILEGKENGSFLVTNLRVVEEKLQEWKRELIMVEPFYAVKCCPDPVILELLCLSGVNFDCATMGEIQLVAPLLEKYGRDISSSVVYANPVKMVHMADFAIGKNIRMTTFDCAEELVKLSKLQSSENLQLLLRIATDDEDSMCQFSNKFGCNMDDVLELLTTAKALGLASCIAGVAFHVGSGCGNVSAYTKALANCETVFQYALSLSMDPHIVDIGGGFPGDNQYGMKLCESGCDDGSLLLPSFSELADAINVGIKHFMGSLQKYGYAEQDTSLVDNSAKQRRAVRFIAEPGRFFASAATSIVSKCIGCKSLDRGRKQTLYIDDGVYGSFNNVLYDHATPVPELLLSPSSNCIPSLSLDSTYSDEEKEKGEDLLPTTIFGPTCDGLDEICNMSKNSTILPQCSIDDWILFKNMGAYTHTASFKFNGFTHIPNRIYCV